MRRPPIHARYVPRLRPRPEARPEKPDHILWSISLALGLVVGVAVYFGSVGPARNAARGVDPTPRLSIVTVPHPDSERDTWCPTPDQRAAADNLIPPPAHASTPTCEDDQPALDTEPIDPGPGLVERLEAIAELLGPPRLGAADEPAERVRMGLVILVDDLKEGRVTRP